MKTIQLELFTFDELSDDAKQVAINDHREIANSHLDDEVSYWQNGALTGTGFVIDEISFSGFYSQGDGASFTGYYDSSQIDVDWLKGFSLKAYELMARNDSIFGASGLTSDNVITADVKRTGRHYCHENTVSVENIEINGRAWGDDEGDKINAAFEAIENYLDSLKDDLCHFIYSNLQSEYEHQNSDEYISEILVINEYYFTADGAIYYEK